MRNSFSRFFGLGEKEEQEATGTNGGTSPICRTRGNGGK